MDVERLATEAHVRVLHVGRARVNPVELVRVRDGFKLLQLEAKLPGVGDEVEEVGRALGGPIVQHILEEELVGVDEVQRRLGADEGEDPLLVAVPEWWVVHGDVEFQRFRFEELSERQRGRGLHHHESAVDRGAVARLGDKPGIKN